MAPPHLDDGVVSEILRWLPSKDLHRCAAVCPSWRAIVSSPALLCRHLSPRPLLDDDRPFAVILQPARKVGYTHLTVVPTDPDVHVDLNLPLDPKYTSMPPVEPRHVAIKPDNETRPVEEDFERTVPMLNISLVASHGRLLLARNPTRYLVCDPAANRWLVLPPAPSISPTREAAPGFHYHYHLDDAAGSVVSFTVVLLARARRGRVRVETFSSATGEWATTVLLGAKCVARRLDVASPGIGIHAGGGGACFYWLCRRRRGHVVRYDAARGRASLVREPPETEGSDGRVWLSLGSAGGRPRMCTFDVFGGSGAAGGSGAQRPPHARRRAAS